MQVNYVCLDKKEIDTDSNHFDLLRRKHIKFNFANL